MAQVGEVKTRYMDGILEVRNALEVKIAKLRAVNCLCFGETRLSQLVSTLSIEEPLKCYFQSKVYANGTPPLYFH